MTFNNCFNSFKSNRNVSQEIYERQGSIQKLMDGATPIVVIDTDDILQSLQKATLKNKEKECASRAQNGSQHSAN